MGCMVCLCVFYVAKFESPSSVVISSMTCNFHNSR